MKLPSIKRHSLASDTTYHVVSINVTLSSNQLEDHPMERLRTLIDGDDLIIAPVALNPLMARMAVEAGFKAVYMIGGSLGWVKCNTEATNTLPEMVDIAIDMRTVSDVPIVLDAGGGWGDPAHIHRTIRMTEVAGFDAIEIEDQLLPRRYSD